MHCKECMLYMLRTMAAVQLRDVTYKLIKNNKTTILDRNVGLEYDVRHRDQQNQISRVVSVIACVELLG